MLTLWMIWIAAMTALYFALDRLPRRFAVAALGAALGAQFFLMNAV